MTNITKLTHSLNILFQQSSPSTKIALAVSGGSDSMFLLYLCAHISKNITVFHVNHQTRPECQEESLFISRYCGELGVEFQELKAENLSLNMGDFENNARKERYRLFTEKAKEYNITQVLTAHHQEDLIETVFLKILRGSLNIFIPKKRVLDSNLSLEIIRPMLFVSKHEIESYLKENDILYIEDSSNNDKKYLRNFLRLEIIPLLKNRIDGFSNKIISLSESREEEEDFLFSYTKQREQDLFVDNKCSVQGFLKEHILIQQRLIQDKMIHCFGVSISRGHLLEIILLIQGNQDHSIVLYSSFHGDLLKENGEIVINLNNPHKMLEKKSFIIHNKAISLKLSEWNIKKVVGQGIVYTIDDEIYLRVPFDGEHISWNKGTKTIREILKDKKIPSSQRKFAQVIIKNDVVVGLCANTFVHLLPSVRATKNQLGLLLQHNKYIFYNKEHC